VRKEHGGSESVTVPTLETWLRIPGERAGERERQRDRWTDM